MDDIRRIEGKLDKVVDNISNINIILAAQHVILETHIARTEALEKQIMPIKEAHIEIKGAIKFIKILGILFAISEAMRLLWK